MKTDTHIHRQENFARICRVSGTPRCNYLLMRAHKYAFYEPVRCHEVTLHYEVLKRAVSEGRTALSFETPGIASMRSYVTETQQTTNRDAGVGNFIRCFCLFLYFHCRRQYMVVCSTPAAGYKLSPIF